MSQHPDLRELPRQSSLADVEQVVGWPAMARANPRCAAGQAAAPIAEPALILTLLAARSAAY